MRLTLPKSKRLVFIGGGHTHALVLRALAMTPINDVLITVINPSNKAPYTGMLPGFVAGHYSQEDVEIDLARLARASNAQIILDEVTNLDPQNKTVHLKNRDPISYDLASVNIGVTSQLPETVGFDKFGHGAKPLGEFASGWRAYLTNRSSQNDSPQIVVIGGGVAGIELALSMAHRLRTTCKAPARITVLERNQEPLSGTSPKAKARLLRYLEKYDIRLESNSQIEEVTQTLVRLTNGTTIRSDFTVGAAGATPHPWISQTGLDCHEGFLKTNAFLQTLTDPFVFACGDCAHFTPMPLPKAGVFAVRQAPVLLKNLRAALENRQPTPYRPQKHYLKLISTGHKSAVSDKFGLTLDGPLLWHLKDRIDRKFMNRLASLPDMNRADHQPVPSATTRELVEKYENLCGGCGAKMHSGHLNAVIGKQPPKSRDDVLSGPGDDAAILKHAGGFQVFTTDHLRAFTNDPWLLGKIAAIHAMGDIWAMGARPQAALATIILPPLADHLHEGMLSEILAAATRVFNTAGADLVGGHTSVGSELTVGFSLTGLSDRHPVQTSGATSGDVLILTKPLGIGTVLAAEMRGLADGYDLEAAYAQMSRPSQTPSEILSPRANAMTDVTGFGLAGHLNQMMINSGTKAKLNIAQVPFMEAALGYAQKGIKSSLWSANRAALPNWTSNDLGKNALLFDPQTAGGLLASYPKEAAQEVVAILRDAGETPHIIGEVTDDGSPGIDLV